MTNKPTDDHPPLTAEDVQDIIRLGCQVPGCRHRPEQHGEMAFSARCHPGTGTYAVARPGEDWLTLRCRTCDAPVARFALAHRTMSWAE